MKKGYSLKDSKDQEITLDNFSNQIEKTRENQKIANKQINNSGLNDIESCTEKKKTSLRQTMKQSMFKTRNNLNGSLKNSFKRNTEKGNKIKTGTFEIKTKKGQVYEVEINEKQEVKLYRYNKITNGVVNKEAGITEIPLNTLGKNIGNVISKQIICVVNEKTQSVGFVK